MDASPRDSAKGNAPRLMARLVIIIGRNLATDASITAGTFLLPANCFLLAKSTIKIPFLVTRPISIIIPICEKIFSVWLNNHNESTAPAMANGTVTMMVKGSIKLSNCAASTRKISTSARIKAKEVLPELSAKSRDEPLSDVVNVSSSNFFEISCMAFIPSPTVLPGASPDEMVADLYRLK